MLATGTMPKTRNDILQGTLTLLVLRSLDARGPMHGYALCGHIQEVSTDLLRVEHGSLDHKNQNMEQDGWLLATWNTTEKGRKAKFYAITALGQAQLAEERRAWERLTRGVNQVLGYC